jgi:hypothetical protein
MPPVSSSACSRPAELPNFRLYDLRHTSASLLLAQNAPITYVAAQLGHAKPTTTLRWYAHWLPTNRRTYVDALDAPEKPSWHQSGTISTNVEGMSKDPELEIWRMVAPRAGLEPATS